MEMARYSEKFKGRAVARLLPPESAAVDVVARKVGIGAGTLERWRDDVQSMPAQGRVWTAAALAEPEEARASPQATRQDRKRIKELEREFLRKDRALAETAALLVLSKKVAALFNKGEDE